MDIRCNKCLFAVLLAVLLALPVAHADAGQVTINVPVEITNAPTGVMNGSVTCRVGMGPAGSGATTIWPAITGRGVGGAQINIVSGGYHGTVRVVVDALDGATHYKCLLAGIAGQPAFHGQNAVSGPISGTVTVTPR